MEISEVFHHVSLWNRANKWESCSALHLQSIIWHVWYKDQSTESKEPTRETRRNQWGKLLFKKKLSHGPSSFLVAVFVAKNAFQVLSSHDLGWQWMTDIQSWEVGKLERRQKGKCHQIIFRNPGGAGCGQHLSITFDFFPSCIIKINQAQVHLFDQTLFWSKVSFLNQPVHIV